MARLSLPGAGVRHRPPGAVLPRGEQRRLRAGLVPQRARHDAGRVRGPVARRPRSPCRRGTLRDVTREPMPSPRLCLWLLGVSLVGLGVLGALFVPWSWVPGGHLVQVRGSDVFTAAQLSRGEAYSSAQRHLGWASLAVSLVLGLALGLTPLGARVTRLLPGPWWLRAVLATLA